MKVNQFNTIFVTNLAAFLSVVSIAVSQPAAAPLQIQGMDQFMLHGVRSRGMGGATVANGSDASAIFSNPAGLSKLTSLEIRAGGYAGKLSRNHTQDWVPQREVPGLGLLFESLTGAVKSPDSAGVPGVEEKDPWKRVQRQYDNILPDWEKNTSSVQPYSAAVAMPFETMGMKIVPGVGFSRTIDLDNYYQNNNSMSPYLGQLRPYVNFYDRSKPADTAHVQWYQYIRDRKGSIEGVTPGIAVTIVEGLTAGGSLTILSGSSDDLETRIERGHVNIAVENGSPQNFMLDTVYYRRTRSGTSTYEGNSATLGLTYEQERFSLGVIVKPAMTITRKWNRTVTSYDSTRKPAPVRINSVKDSTYRSIESGTDRVNFPLSYSLGFVLTPTKKWTVAFDYEIRSLADVTMTTSGNSTVSHPWIGRNANIHVGAEYRMNDMLVLRGGYRDEMQSFSPDGSAIINEPGRSGAYSAGVGLVIENIIIDAAYEYSRLTYQDIYQSNANYNTIQGHQFLMEVAYRF